MVFFWGGKAGRRKTQSNGLVGAKAAQFSQLKNSPSPKRSVEATENIFFRLPNVAVEFSQSKGAESPM